MPHMFCKACDKRSPRAFRCHINICGQRHNRLFHANTSSIHQDNTSRQDEARGADETISGETCCYVNQSQRGFRVILPVEVKAGDVAVQTYAFLDAIFNSLHIFNQSKFKTFSMFRKIFRKFFYVSCHGKAFSATFKMINKPICFLYCVCKCIEK